jgi:hypothetical protein
LFGERKPFPAVVNQSDSGLGDFSPDGRWIAYVSAEAGQEDVYVAPFRDAGEKVRVSNTGLAQNVNGVTAPPRWRSNGREICYLDAAGMLTAASVRISNHSVAVEKITPLFKLTPAQGTRIFWDVSADGERFLVTANEQQASAPVTLVINWSALLNK